MEPEYGYHRGGHIYVGDVPHTFPLTFPSTTTTIPGMARTDVVEFTHHTSRDSESIAEIWWNANTYRLTVRFHSGGVYSYDEVGKSLYNEFARAESMGKFFRETFRMSEWPGAKHVESLVRYQPVAIEGGWEEDTDLDSLKVTRLTSSAEGGNQKFTVHYEYAGESDVDVRAANMDEAIDLVEQFFADRNVKVAVTGVYIEVKK
jgi:hypothetical protein